MNLTALGICVNAGALVVWVLVSVLKFGVLQGTVTQIDKRLDRIESRLNGVLDRDE